MNKLPVFRTFANALGFTFGNFFTIFRLAWLPFAAMLTAIFALNYYVFDLWLKGPSALPMFDPLTMGEHIDQFVFLNIAVSLLKALVVASVAVAIHRVILFGDRKPGAYFNFAFGTTEFLYLVMGLLTALLVLAIMGALLTPAVYFAANGDLPGFFAQFKDFPRNMPQLMMSGVLRPLMFAYSVGALIVLFFVLRLAVWPPSVVATGSLSPAEPWRLTRGNAWRFIGLMLLAVLCFYVVAAVIVAVVYFQFAHFAPAVDPAHLQTIEAPKDPAAMREMVRKTMQQQVEIWAPYAPLFWFCYLLVYVFVTGFSVALISYSYKALKGYDADAPIPEGG